MPYSTASASIRSWYPVPWHAPSWQQITAGLPALPPSLYMPAILALPLYSSTVLLLDAAPAVSNTLLAGGIGVVVAIVGWLLNRTISAFDSSVKRQEETLSAVSKLVTKLSEEMVASNQLIGYLKGDVAELKQKKETLEKAHAAMDKQIGIMLDRKEHGK